MNPFDRLKFWTVAHELRHRLEPYQITEVPRPFRRFTWNDLRYWQLLIDEPDIFAKEWRVEAPEEWFGKVEV